MAASNYTSYFAIVMMLSTITSSMSQTEQKEGLRIETVYAPSPGCYGVNYGDFYIGVENITLADGTVLTTSYM